MASTITIKCPSCGHENPIGNRLCDKCQLVLELAATGQLPPTPESRGIFKSGSTHISKKLYLHVRGSSEPIEILLEGQKEMVLGRTDPRTGSSPEVELSNYGASDKGVSRRHAKLTYDGRSLRVIDLNSANATFLNGYKLVANQPRILRDGDEVRLGKLSFTVQFGEDMVTVVED